MSFSREQPSPRYQELLKLYRSMHEEGSKLNNLSAEETFAGGSLDPHIGSIRKLLEVAAAKSLLDYGAGKGNKYRVTPFTFGGETAPSLQAYWGVDRLVCYDPAYAPYSSLPTERFGAVICTDVLEHIPETDISWILTEQFKLATKFVFGNIASFPASKTLPSGENAHCTVRPVAWWRDTIAKAHAESGSPADYYYIVESKLHLKKLFGMKTKIKSHYEAVSNRQDWLMLGI